MSLGVDNDGAIKGGEVSWAPPRDPGDDFPRLQIDYSLKGSRLGAVMRVRAAAEVIYETGWPKSQAAQATLDLDGHRWQEPWALFAAHVSEDRARAAAGAKNVPGFWGIVPLAYVGEGASPTNPDLASAIDHGVHAKLTIEGDSGEAFGSHAFDLTDLVTRDRLFREALAEAREAAKTPGSCEEGDGAP